MRIVVDGETVFLSTGSRPFDACAPAVLFLHGAGMDHSVFAAQTRWFANRGRAALAVDLPGHGESEGAPLPDIGAMAGWTIRLLDALGVEKAALVGHSMGAMVALAAAARHPRRARALGLIGAGLRMAVSKPLLDAAAANAPEAVDMVNLWGFGPRAGLGGASAPGQWMIGAGDRILARSKPGVLHNDLAACDGHLSSAEEAAKIACPTLIVQGARDMMTPLKGAQALAGAIDGARLVALDGAGHMPMIECEEDTRAALATLV